MKTKPSPLPYPSSKEEEFRWGFDIYQPEGTPLAWVTDWSCPNPGWGVTPERAMEILAFQVGEDLSKIPIDEWLAALSMLTKMTYQIFYNTLQANLGVEKAAEIARNIGLPGGQMQWSALQSRFGSPVPLEKIIWYQDFFHILSGPTMRPHSWCDGKKAVVSRTQCTNKPPEGMDDNIRYCRACCDASLEGYMTAEPELLMIRVPTVGDTAKEPRCIHLFTYDKEVIENLPQNLKRRIPRTTRKMLADKGVRL